MIIRMRSDFQTRQKELFREPATALLIVKVSKRTLKGATKIEVFLDQTILKRFFRMRFFLYEKTFEGFFF